MRAGPEVRACIFTESKRRGRAPKTMPTPPWRDWLNIKSSREKLLLALACNFAPTDWVVTLTYDDAHLPKNRDAARRRLKKFIRQLREGRRSRGAILKYIYVIEGQHGDHRLHHHIVINRLAGDWELINSIWPDGSIDRKQLAHWGYEGTANYLTKEPSEHGRPYVGDKMWVGSRNLAQPEVVSKYVPDNAKLDVPANAIDPKLRMERCFGQDFQILKYSLPWFRKGSRKS